MIILILLVVLSTLYLFNYFMWEQFVNAKGAAYKKSGFEPSRRFTTSSSSGRGNRFVSPIQGGARTGKNVETRPSKPSYKYHGGGDRHWNDYPSYRYYNYYGYPYNRYRYYYDDLPWYYRWFPFNLWFNSEYDPYYSLPYYDSYEYCKENCQRYYEYLNLTPEEYDYYVRDCVSKC